jgi:hypothetical protein
LAATKAVVDVDVEGLEAEEVEVGDVVKAPAVVAGGASGAFRMSEGEGGVEDGEDSPRSPVFATETCW